MKIFRDNIESGNEKIAKFLGWFQQEGQEGTWFVNDGTAIHVAYSIHNNYPHRDLPFHRDWNMLMDVIAIIEDLDPNPRVTHMYSIEITGNGSTAYKNITYGDESRIIYRHNTHNNRLQNTFLVVVKFIEWYMEKEKNKQDV